MYASGRFIIRVSKRIVATGWMTRRLGDYGKQLRGREEGRNGKKDLRV